MRITNPPPFNNKPHYALQFARSEKRFTNEFGRDINAHVTSIYRKNLYLKDWNVFNDNLIKHYKNKIQTTIYSLASSTCDELFGLLMLLTKKLNAENIPEKFLPAIAVDNGKDIHKYAKKGILKLSKEDIEKIKQVLGDNYSDYIDFDYKFKYIPEHSGDKEPIPLCNGILKLPLKDKVTFINADITEYVKTIKGDNNIVLCQHVLPYIPDEDLQKFAKNLSNNIGDNSIFVTSDWDAEHTLIHYYLLNAGFVWDKTNCWYAHNHKNKFQQFFNF